MDRSLRIAALGLCLVLVGTLPGVAWAGPMGAADVSQITNGGTSDPNGGQRQRTFLTTDLINIHATYYDNNAACSGVDPTFVQLFIFNLEGLVRLEVGAESAVGSPSLGPKYRSLFTNVSASTLGSGDYKFAFLVRDCTNAKSVVLPVFLTFRVLTP